MSDQQLQHLIKMINQIGANNLHYDNDDEAADMVAKHLKKFWAPSMRSQLLEYAAVDGDGLSGVSRLALRKLEDAASPSAATD